MNKSKWIKKLNELDPPPKNKLDKGGQHLIKCMDYYNVKSLSELTEEQLENFYNEVKNYGTD